MTVSIRVMPDESVPRCDACRWWRAGQAMNRIDGQCLRVERPDPGMYAHRDRDSIDTRADFGCVLWEPVGVTE